METHRIKQKWLSLLGKKDISKLILTYSSVIKPIDMIVPTVEPVDTIVPIKEGEITEHKIRRATYKIVRYLKSGYYQDKYQGLIALDGDTRISIPGYTKFIENRYKAVSSEYLQEYVLECEVSLRVVNFILMSLLKGTRVKSFFCTDVKQVIFTLYHGWGTRSFNGLYDGESSYKSYYKTHLTDYDTVAEYLESNKTENTNSGLAIFVQHYSTGNR